MLLDCEWLLCCLALRREGKEANVECGGFLKSLSFLILNCKNSIFGEKQSFVSHEERRELRQNFFACLNLGNCIQGVI